MCRTLSGGSILGLNDISDKVGSRTKGSPVGGNVGGNGNSSVASRDFSGSLQDGIDLVDASSGDELSGSVEVSSSGGNSSLKNELVSVVAVRPVLDFNNGFDGTRVDEGVSLKWENKKGSAGFQSVREHEEADLVDNTDLVGH